MKLIGRIFLTGLAAIVPILATLYLIYWLIVTTESLLGGLFQNLLPVGWYIPGTGLVAGLLVVFLVGVLMHAWLVQKLYSLAEHLLYRIPLIRSVYGSIRDFFDLFSHSQKEALHQTVMLSFNGIQLIGFVTRWDLDDLPTETDATENITVYLPMSYMIGGYMVIVPRSSVKPIDMSVENAMSFILTAGVTGKHGGGKHGRSPPSNKAGEEKHKG